MKTPTNADNRRCEHCESTLESRVYKHTQNVGKWKTTDGGAFALYCKNCDKPSLTLDQLQNYQIAAAKTVLCEGKLDSDVIRYARKALGLTQKELGTLLDYEHETISRWENGKESMSRTAAGALVGILCRALDGELTEDMVQKAKDIRDEVSLNSEQTMQVRRRIG